MPSDAVLGFDTSGGWIAAALVRGGCVLAQRHDNRDRGQAEALMPTLSALLAEAGLDWRDLAAIGVGTGPGNFTGIRISVAAARGLALGLGVPAIGISQFDALALDGPALPVVVRALRDQVWVRAADEAPRLGPCPAIGIGEGLTPAAHPLAVAVALLADQRRRSPQPRPAPLYLRDPDAAPPSEAPPPLVG